MTKEIQSFAYMQTHMHRFRGLRMESSVELLCGCCLKANTDGLPICWPAHAPQSVGQRASLCFTVSTCGCIRMCSCTKVCRSLRVRPRKLSRTSPHSLSPFFEKTARSCQTFVLGPTSPRIQTAINEKTQRGCLFAFKGGI